MPPAHKRNIDDSRSETSSSVPNHKDGKNHIGPTSGPGIPKTKRIVNGSSAKAPVNVLAGSAPAVAINPPSVVDKDPKLPRTDWISTPNAVLRTYRTAYRLHVPSTFSHPHADIIYNSSQTGLRAPSAVLARRRLREEKHRRRKLDHDQQINGTTTTSSNKIGKSKNNLRQGEKDKTMTKELNAETSSTTGSTVAQSIEPPDATQSSDQTQARTQPHPPSSPSSTSTTYLGPREPGSQLAAVVRKHFNAQQVSEADTIARFTYVVQQAGRSVWTEGCGGDSTGYWMGSHGREVRKADGPGGEVGFRLRFRP
ncbi:uncharacterized protein A1O9_04575 [Exophiala aquamarina CBS 119918]|uniref:Histone deacetylase complex subunit SAP30 Sin3 binding domain-containing protein n=1 Tax=Exophiala aquamarina CBS 119918 TaxID=1182545 RepID=A0A072PI00_9EURO|nr:uncharacterized protein A1O9_04575 [Exophiala aquamarina CBS 119918]KEF59729.1 hypothetical protein A1O9_04575 [Exophiala aquamarina CBS 119918]